jgi:hypothetical protein
MGRELNYNGRSPSHWEKERKGEEKLNNKREIDREKI